MNSNFTDYTPHESNEVLVAINFSLSNQNQYAQTRNDSERSERSEASTRQYESIPFASTETTFSTNPFLPRMTDPSGISNSRHNNIVSQNDQPTYLPSAYDSPYNIENLSGNNSRNSLSTNQNSGLASSSNYSSNSIHLSHALSHPSWGQSRQGCWASGTETAPVTNHCARTIQWEHTLPNTSSSRSSFLPRASNSGTVFNSWPSRSRNHFNAAMSNSSVILEQIHVNPASGRTISSSSPIPLAAPTNQFNPRVISEVNPSAEISDSEDCVVITTVERRYIYGRGEMTWRDEPNIIDAYAAGPSNAGPLHYRSNGNTINRDHPLQPRSYQGNSFHSCNGSLPCNCNCEYRPHPYMSIVHSSQFNTEGSSGRLSVQSGRRRTSVSGINTELPPFESINLTPPTREINQTSTWINPINGLINNSFPQYTANEVSNRGIVQTEDPFAVDVTNEDPISIDHLRPSISFADVEGLPNLIGSASAPVNYPRNEPFEFNITNISNQNTVNNPTHNTLRHNQTSSNLRNALLQNQFIQSMDEYEIHRRHYEQYNRMRNYRSPRTPYYVNDVRTTSTQSQTESITIPQPPPSYSQTYKRKKDSFRAMLKPPTGVPKNFEIKIKRSRVFEDSYRIITTVDNIDKLKAKLWVVFEGEVGLDYGGVQREWFYLLSKEMFNPNYGFFEYSTTSNYSLQINPNSGICTEQHLNYFMFIGRIVGMAVYHEKLLDASFSQIFYKMWKQKPITLEDLKKVDPQYYQTLSWIKENDPAHLDLDFTINEDLFGHVSVKDLIPNGSKVAVTNYNKAHYIEFFIKWRFESRMKDQMQAFLTGFHDLIPKHALHHFNENELEPLICGTQKIDYRDWRSHTAYSGGYTGRHPTIRWFWSLVKSFSDEMKAKLLQFVTGTSRLPMNGFKELIGSNGPLLFTIQNIGSCDSLPRAHTCFNRLDLPPYKSEQQLREKLLYALEGCEGFNGVD